MTQIRQYDYSNTAQRRLFKVLTLLISLCAGALFSETVTILVNLFPYSNSFTYAGIGLIVLHMTGFSCGKWIFGKNAISRLLFICLLAGFCILSGLIIMKAGTKGWETTLAANLFVNNRLFPFGVLLLIPFIWGFLNSYCLKVLCGIFFDEKRGGEGFVAALFAGFVCGIVLSLTAPAKPMQIALFGCIGIIFFLIIFIRAEFSPKSFYAQDIGDSVTVNDEENSRIREDLFFSYLNFSSIIVYLFLASVVVPSFYGGSYYNRLCFFILLFPMTLLGYILPSFVKVKRFFFFYVEIAYPFLFGAWFLVLFSYHGKLPLLAAILLFTPVAALFGASFRYSIRASLFSRDQSSSSSMIGFSLFFLPTPILFALGIVPMTWSAFIIIFYLSALLNIGAPAIFNAQLQLNEFRKTVYFIFLGFTVVLFAFTHIYLKIPFNTSPVVKQSEGIENIVSINYTSDYIIKTADVYINRTIAYHASDQNIRSLNQAVISLSLFCSNKKDRVLFLDGNNPFYNNSAETLFKNSIRVDYVPRAITQYERVALSTQREIATIDESIIRAFRSTKGSFECIIDMPNINDSNDSSFRFSKEYFDIVKTQLTGKKIYGILVNVMRSNKTSRNKIWKNFRSKFNNVTVFRFGEYVLMLGSDKNDSLIINDASIQSLKEIISEEQKLSYIMYSELHCISHIIYTGESSKGDIDIFGDSKKMALPESYKADHTGGLNGIISPVLKSQISNALSGNAKMLTLLKQAEEASIAGDLESETKLLLELKKIGDYNPVIRQYADYHLSARSAVFTSVSLQYEKEKQWEDAAKVLKAMLVLTPNDPDINYRMSVVLLTLQDIEGSSTYLQIAMKLQPNNPNNMHQMGVILFSTAKYTEAIEYLLKAIALQKSDAVTYYYLGVCYEELGRLNEAKQSFDTAIQKDSRNPDVVAASERIKEKLKKQSDQWQQPEQKNQNETESGENFPLPITKSAIDVRLKDDDAVKTK